MGSANVAFPTSAASEVAVTTFCGCVCVSDMHRGMMKICRMTGATQQGGLGVWIVYKRSVSFHLNVETLRSNTIEPLASLYVSCN